MKFGRRQALPMFGTLVLGLAVLSGVAAAAFQPVEVESLARPERVERAKPPLPKLEEVLDKLVADGRITATQREAILAAVKEHADKAEAKRPAFSWKGHLGSALRTAATFLGLTEKDLRAALREGKSLTELAVAKGRSREALLAAISAPANASINEALAANKMTAEQATKARAEIAERAAKLVDAKHELKLDKVRAKDQTKDRQKDERRSEQKIGLDARRLLGDSLRSAIAYLGLESKAVHEQLRSGKSLAELATAGKTREGLVAAISAPANAKVDELKAAGKLTEEQATKIKAQVAHAAVKIVDAKAKVRR